MLTTHMEEAQDFLIWAFIWRFMRESGLIPCHRRESDFNGRAHVSHSNSVHVCHMKRTCTLNTRTSFEMSTDESNSIAALSRREKL